MTNRSRTYWMYIMQSTSRRVLYTGVTSDLRHRVWQHKNHKFDGFTDKYEAIRLVYYEEFDDIRKAIHREKQIKGWRRNKREELIAGKEPHWRDLSDPWFQAPPEVLELKPTLAREQFCSATETQGPSTPLRSAQGDVPRK